MKLWGRRKPFKQDTATQQDCVLRHLNFLKSLRNSEKKLFHATSILGGRLEVHKKYIKLLDQGFLTACFIQKCFSKYLEHCPDCDGNEHD